MRVKVDYRTASKESYKDFCNKHPHIQLSFDEWRNILYTYIEIFKQHMLETGEKAKLPSGIGEFFINKKKREKVKEVNGKEIILLPIDWKKTREKGKRIYNFNFHTEGYLFRWKWNKRSSRIKFPMLWYFKPSRVTARLLAHYLKVDEKYQHVYREWLNNKK